MRTHKHASPVHVRPMTMPLGSVPEPTIADLDPTDPAQTLDEAQDFHLEPLDINVMPDAEQRDDLDAAVELSDADANDDEDDADERALIDPQDQTADERTAHAADTGDLYGVHVARADAPEHGSGPENGQYAESALGQSWLETLETDAVEGGPIPEAEIDANDDADRTHGDESGDRPVADKGSGGPAGL